MSLALAHHFSCESFISPESCYLCVVQATYHSNNIQIRDLEVIALSFYGALSKNHPYDFIKIQVEVFLGDNHSIVMAHE